MPPPPPPTFEKNAVFTFTHSGSIYVLEITSCDHCISWAPQNSFKSEDIYESTHLFCPCCLFKSDHICLRVNQAKLGDFEKQPCNDFYYV